MNCARHGTSNTRLQCGRSLSDLPFHRVQTMSDLRSTRLFTSRTCYAPTNIAPFRLTVSFSSCSIRISLLTISSPLKTSCRVFSRMDQYRIEFATSAVAPSFSAPSKMAPGAIYFSNCPPPSHTSPSTRTHQRQSGCMTYARRAPEAVALAGATSQWIRSRLLAYGWRRAEIDIGIGKDPVVSQRADRALSVPLRV